MIELNKRKTLHGVTAVALWLAVAVVWGCGQQQEAEQVSAPAPYGQEETAQQADPSGGMVQEQALEATPQEPAGEDTTATESSAQGTTIQVQLRDFVIDMPKTLKPGPTTFTVVNEGNVIHNLEIKGQGIDKVFDTNLEPGDTKTMEVDLQPGEYRVYCPVGSHAERGMDMTLTVSGQ